MAWYNMVPALTPLAVFDADSTQVSGALQDRSGLSITLALNNQPVRAAPGDTMTAPLRKAVRGSADRVQYSRAVSFPSTGLFVALLRPTGPVVLNASRAGGEGYLLAFNASTKKWYQAEYQPTDVITDFVWQVVALWWDATSYRIFVNDNWGGAAVNWVYKPSTLLGMVYSKLHYLNGSLSAHGLFSGAATLSDIQAIATELNSQFLLPPPQGLSTQPQLAPVYLNPLAQQPGPPRTRGLTVLRAWKNIYQGGSGTIQGTVTIETIPGARQVRLFDKRTGLVIGETWSTVTGHYEFNNIDPTREYFVVAHDHLRVYNAVVQDMLTP